MPVAVDLPVLGAAGGSPAPSVHLALSLGLPPLGAVGGTPVPQVLTNTLPPGVPVPTPKLDQVVGYLYQHDGVTPIMPIVSIIGCKWRDALVPPGMVTFMVAADDPAAALIGPVQNQTMRYVRLTWLRRGVPQARMQCRVWKRTGETIVEGRIFYSYENQPDVNAVLADAVCYPEKGGVPDPDVTDRRFGFGSAPGAWFFNSEWRHPKGFPWSEDPTVRHGSPIDFRADNPDWIAMLRPDVNQPAGRVNYFRAQMPIVGVDTQLEVVATGDNFLTLDFDNEEKITPDYSKPRSWGEAFHAFVTQHADTRPIIAAKVENSALTSGANPIGFICIVYTLDAHGNRTGVALKSNTTDWRVAAGPPEPGWRRAQVLRKLWFEAAAVRGVLGPAQVTAAFSDTFDSHGEKWTDRQGWIVPIGDKQNNLAETTIQMVEHEADSNIDYTMRWRLWKRRGQDRSETVFLARRQDGGGLTSYQATITAPEFTHVLMRLNDGSWREQNYAVPIGRIESGFQMGSTESDFSAFAEADAQLDVAAYRTVEVDATHSVSNQQAGPIPYVDYFIGDTVSVPDPDGGDGYVTARLVAFNLDGSTDVLTIEPELVVDDAGRLTPRGRVKSAAQRAKVMLSRMASGGGYGGSRSARTVVKDPLTQRAYSIPFAIVEHGDDPDVARPPAQHVRWVGAATPNNAVAYDDLYPQDL